MSPLKIAGLVLFILGLIGVISQVGSGPMWIRWVLLALGVVLYVASYFGKAPKV